MFHNLSSSMYNNILNFNEIIKNSFLFVTPCYKD